MSADQERDPVEVGVWPGTPDRTYFVPLDDGARLHAELFERPDARRRGRVLIFLHGIGSYAAPYRRLAPGVLAAVDAVLIPDMRGHGRSDAPRGVMGPPARVLADIAGLLRHARERWPDSEVVLGGESMGGLIALASAASGVEPVDRLLLLAPALRLRGSAGSIRTALEASLGPEPGFRIHGARVTDEGPRHPEFQELCRTDPLMLFSARAGYFVTIAGLMAGWEARYPQRVEVPCLIVQGTSDVVIEASGSTTLADRLPGARLHLVDGAWHNLLWDETTPATLAEIAGWLEEPGGDSG